MKYADFLQRDSLSQADLLGLAWGTLFEDPPTEFGRLPAPPMLMLDRVSKIVHQGVKGTIIGEQDIRLDAWFFQCHFCHDPVQPGCLGVDAIWQLIGLYCMLRGGLGSGRALGCKNVEFMGQIRPYNRHVRYEVDIRRYTELKDSGAVMAIGNGRVLVDDELIYTIHEAKVGLFANIAYTSYPQKTQQAVGGLLQS